MPDTLLRQNIVHLLNPGMEVEPFLWVILYELVLLCLLGDDKKSPYLCELPSLEVSEIASCQELRIIRHVMMICLSAQNILLLQCISLTDSLKDI